MALRRKRLLLSLSEEEMQEPHLRIAEKSLGCRV